jgi:hypothetical protein
LELNYLASSVIQVNSAGVKILLVTKTNSPEGSTKEAGA